MLVASGNFILAGGEETVVTRGDASDRRHPVVMAFCVFLQKRMLKFPE